MDDLRDRLANRVQLTSDGHKAYLEAVEGAFGGDVDYAQLVKVYGAAAEGSPDPKHISTSFAERQNLTMRMQMGRFTRLTNAFSKKFENHMHMIAIYTVWYNYVKQHKSLKELSPDGGGDQRHALVNDGLGRNGGRGAAKPGKRGPYKKGPPKCMEGLQ